MNAKQEYINIQKLRKVENTKFFKRLPDQQILNQFFSPVQVSSRGTKIVKVNNKKACYAIPLQAPKYF